MPTEEQANALDAPQTLNEYRSVREGNAPKRETPPAKEPPAPAKEEPKTEEPAADGEPEAVDPDADKAARKKEKLNLRFSELSGKITEREQRIRDLEGQLAANRGAAAPVEKPAETKAEAEPDPDKYTDYNAYQRDLVRYEVRQEARANAAKEQADRQAAAERQKYEGWSERVKKAQALHPDYEALTSSPTLPITPVMAQAITDSEIGTEVAYHLGQHPDEAARIAALSPIAQVRELGRLEATLGVAEKPNKESEDDEDDSEPQTTKPVSKAPKPLKPISGGSYAPNPIRNLEGMTQAEYRAYRESGKIR